MSTVTVVIPTLAHRHDELQNALHSISQQTFQDFNVLVMPDGPDFAVTGILQSSRYAGVRALWQEGRIEVLCLGRHWPHYGHVNRLVAGYLCQSEYMAHLDDDNGYRPRHLELLVAACKSVDFAYSQMIVNGETVVGDGDVRVGKIDSSTILHKTETLRLSTWHPQEDDYIGDGRLAERWVAAGAKYAFVPEITVDYGRVRHGQ